MNEDKMKKDLEEIETINIELDHRVSNLIAENEYLKQTYKQLYDSIKPARIRSKEQCDGLITQVNLKSVEISDLNARLQERVLVITVTPSNLTRAGGILTLRDIPLDSVVVLRYEKRSKIENKGKVLTEMELVLEQTQQDRSSWIRRILKDGGDDEVIFDMDQSIKRSPTEDDECYGVDDLDNANNAEAQELLANDTTDSFF
ncbi:hypothetical protein Tco_1029525 [Tanacetum coccineum]|uniref:Uncharacterized protein n=1 Tax=Tanacetum coccineum TaxID=301880 RepID=A0ABQ5G3P4_9ASTR